MEGQAEKSDLKPLFERVMEHGFADLLLRHGFKHMPSDNYPGNFELEGDGLTWRVLLAPNNEFADRTLKDTNAFYIHGEDDLARRFFGRRSSDRLWKSEWLYHNEFQSYDAYLSEERTAWRDRNPDPVGFWQTLKSLFSKREPWPIDPSSQYRFIDPGYSQEIAHIDTFIEPAQDATIARVVCSMWERGALPVIRRFPSRESVWKLYLSRGSDVFIPGNARRFDSFTGDCGLYPMIGACLLGDIDRARQVIAEGRDACRRKIEEIEISDRETTGANAPNSRSSSHAANLNELQGELANIDRIAGKFEAWVETQPPTR